MSVRRFVTLDVFTDERFSGNPLAVVLDSAGLRADQMQRIAREFNLSETVFVLPPRDPAHLARLRIFMPYRELPFAGHPTVGAAVLLAIERNVSLAEDLNFTLEEEVGPIPCTVHLRDKNEGRAFFELPRLPEKVESELSVGALASALGLSPDDIGLPGHAPSVYTAGNPFVFVPVRDMYAMQRIAIRPELWTPAFGGTGQDCSAFVYTSETESRGSAYHARMLEPGLGEDPATGSAVAAFAGVIMAFAPPPDGSHTLVVEQGYEMGRPSRIVLGIEVRGGRLERATIGGDVVLVSEGTIRA